MERKEFREVLATLLADELGVFESGMPAIWTDAGDTPTMRSGLLCLVERQRNPVSHRAILNYQAEQNFDWIARLVQHDRSRAGLSAFDRACCKIRQRFPNHRERPLPNADGRYPQVTFLCNFDALINTFVPG
jgi:hypothetical protein